MAEFDAGLFGCFDDIMICLQGFFVPCFLSAHTKAKLDERECHLCDCCCYNFNVEWFNRQQIRSKYGMDFNFIMDCVFVTFCTNCVACQQSREVNERSG
eukprot:TRINITY_DN13610_c0_g1_i1.p1 TRINITY_DN13610_c0_g1~~TRINITY_DN13610_c0_g1_i1.p1  ORF type:complete len:106 (+),score=18.08 TRINITY_DN13610_c0_g1_i1:22-318(+)